MLGKAGIYGPIVSVPGTGLPLPAYTKLFEDIPIMRAQYHLAATSQSVNSPVASGNGGASERGELAGLVDFFVMIVLLCISISGSGELPPDLDLRF